MYALVVIAGIGVIVVGWSLGYAGGSWASGKPVFDARPAGSASARIYSCSPSPLPDHFLSLHQVADKSERTRRLMARLAETDRPFDPVSLRNWIWNYFHEVQRCWQERDSGLVKDRMTPTALSAYERGIADMRRRKMVNKLEPLSLCQLHFVHVACPAATAAQSITALLTFQASSRYVHECTGAYISGGGYPATFQEFRTFRRDSDQWLLHEVEASRDSTLLSKSNEVAGFTEPELRNAEFGVIML
jgi:hypothetical protein